MYLIKPPCSWESLKWTLRSLVIKILSKHIFKKYNYATSLYKCLRTSIDRKKWKKKPHIDIKHYYICNKILNDVTSICFGLLWTQSLSTRTLWNPLETWRHKGTKDGGFLCQLSHIPRFSLIYDAENY